MVRRKSHIGLLCLLLSALLSRAQYPGQQLIGQSTAVQPVMKAYSFDLKDVRLSDSRFKDNMTREGRWLLALPNERLIHSFRVNAGMLTDKKDSKTKMPEPLGGWEALDMELRGHSIGHILSGLALQYAATGNEAFRKKSDSLVTSLAEVQKALGQDGYLSAYPRYYIDRNIAGKAVWAPWYTLHKIFAGLIDTYSLTGNPQALEILNGMAGWAYNKLATLSSQQLAGMLRNEYGGMNEAFYNLYAITGNPHHLELARLFYHHAALDPLAEQEDRLNKLHANTIIPKITGEARNYELTGNEKGRQIATYFWNEVVAQHTYAIGSNSDHEHFFEPGKIAAHLTGYTGETCNTYNMLKITRHLFCWYAKALYADYYEQALYNHILGQQDPATGMVCYFTPMLAGAYRLYSTYDRSFWCCVGSGFESHSKYAEAIYYHDGKGIYINLFIPSVLTWKEKGITLTQETKFPESATTQFTIGSNVPVDVPLYIRYPAWAKDGAEIKINGRNIKQHNKPGSYIVLNRKWKNGDKIEVTYPMSLRLVTAPDNSTKAAIAYGPVVLAGKMGTQDMPAPFHDPADPYQYYNYDYKVPATLVHSLDPAQIRPVIGSPLTFTTKDITLVPYYDLHHERYVVYWDLEKSKAQAQHKYDFTPVENKVQGWIDSSYYPGAGVIIAKDNKVIYEHYFGSYQPGTVAYIASAGKWLAVAAIAAVVDEGRLSWNDKVKKWLPEFKDGKGEATLAQLLSHTAGYPDYQPEGRRPDNYQSLEESVAHIVSLPADTAPGAVFHYGGLAMQVAGRMAELATGKQWETIFQEKIAIPLGMKDTHFTPVDETPGHNPMIGGGARCTLRDYAAFLSMISGDGVYKGKRVLSEQAVKVMQADHTGKAYVKYGEFVHNARHTSRNDIYGLGEWREEVNSKNEAVLISSPGWAGAYPWIDKTNNTYGFILARINTENAGKTGFSSFYAGSQLPVMVRQILEF